MEYTNNRIFNIKYNKEENKLKFEQKKWTSQILNSLKNNKWLITTLIAFLMFSTVNLIMINKFIEILQNI